MTRNVVVVLTFWLASFVILLISGLVFYWGAVDRATPTEILGGEIVRYERQTDNSWIMVVRWHGERKRYCWGVAKRWITNAGDSSIGLMLPLEDTAYPPDSRLMGKGPYYWDVPIHLPAYFAATGHVSGAYKIRILYSCNPLQDHFFPIVIEPPAIEFTLPAEPATRPPMEGHQ